MYSKSFYTSFAELMVSIVMYFVFVVCCMLVDLIKMAGGQSVVPIEIEESIKSEVDFLSNVMLIGDEREHLTCLLTLKVRANKRLEVFSAAQ